MVMMNYDWVLERVNMNHTNLNNHKNLRSLSGFFREYRREREGSKGCKEKHGELCHHGVLCDTP
jgi:hypothetical protein